MIVWSGASAVVRIPTHTSAQRTQMVYPTYRLILDEHRTARLLWLAAYDDPSVTIISEPRLLFLHRHGMN